MGGPHGGARAFPTATNAGSSPHRWTDVDLERSGICGGATGGAFRLPAAPKAAVAHPTGLVRVFCEWESGPGPRGHRAGRGAGGPAPGPFGDGPVPRMPGPPEAAPGPVRQLPGRLPGGPGGLQVRPGLPEVLRPGRGVPVGLRQAVQHRYGQPRPGVRGLPDRRAESRGMEEDLRHGAVLVHRGLREHRLRRPLDGPIP
mmetsp:Transcript_32208/g.57775  ORF Transcript_32208/g.57775 Transcript_32208/m.57775 type:complete len:200 (-) Transcript_32208:2995-3594(-)